MDTTRGIDISVVITAHHEGRLAHHTMRSLFRAKDYASQRGLEIEIIIVLDRANQATNDYFSSYHGSGIAVETADFGDLGLSRNFGIGLTSGRYVGIMDADNLIGRNWLYEAVLHLRRSSRPVIAHPEYQMVFEKRNFVFRQISSTDDRFRISNIIEYNYWDAVCVTNRDIFLKCPYESTTRTQGFGFEDWHWNCQTLSEGIEHHVVPDTVHFMREKRSGSLLSYSREGNRIIRPSRLFDPSLFSRLIRAEG